MTNPAPEAKVVTISDGGRVRVLFEGLARDAKTFIERNFPRVHTEPGSNTVPKADAHVVVTDPDSGDVHQLVYHGEDSGWHKADAQGNLLKDEDDDVQEPTEPEE